MGVLRTDRVSGLGGANAINGSVHFPNDGATGTGDYLRVDRVHNSNFNLGTNDFTMEFWFNSENVGSTLFPFAFAAPTVSASSDAGFYVRFNGGVVNFNCFEGNNTIGACSTGSVNEETWYHVAYVRSGSTFTVYLDGTSAATASSAEAVNYNAGWNFNIGSAYTNVYHYNGFLSNLRIVNGTALYTSNFTVPNRRLEAVENTVLLCCQSPGNVLQEASGKTLHTIGLSLDSKSVPSTVHASRFVPDVGEDYGTTFADGAVLDTLSYMVPPGGTTAQSNRGRAVIGWANNPVNTGMDYFSIQSMGNSISFGTLTSGNRWGSHALSSSTRGLFVGGYINTPASTFFNTIDYVTIATTSNPIDFGDVTTASYRSGCCSSSTRGIIALGFVTPAFGKVNTIDLVTIATLGNATNFGDLFQTRANMSSLSSPTRGVFAGGETPTYVNTIDYVTIATTGDASNFGDLNYTPISSMAMASTTRGIIGGGYPTPANTNIIDFITIASTGDATDFGDLTGLYSVGSATSNSIRGVFCGGYTSPSKHNLMEFVTIATTGNASDFGDMLYSRRDFGACSDSHGGIS